MKLITFALTGLLLLSINTFAKDNSLTQDEKALGWQLLFNGKDMSQWRNFKKPDLNNKWQVENGVIKLTAKGGGDILTKKTYENFEQCSR